MRDTVRIRTLKIQEHRSHVTQDCLSGTDLCAATGMGETLMDNNQEAIRKLTQAMNRIDGLYYQAARKLGVKSNTLAIFYALDDGQSHSQKQLCEEWLIPKNHDQHDCKGAGRRRLSDPPY